MPKAAVLEIEYTRSSGVRKEAVIESLLKRRGTHPGLVHVLPVMEGCTTYKLWHDKGSGKTFLKCDQSKYLTFYFYFMDEVPGLCYVRVDKKIVLTLARGQFNIYGFRCNDLAKYLVQFLKHQLRQLLKRLRMHGLLKKIGKSYKYYLASFGKEIITCSQKVINMAIIPQLAKSA